jgi:hypothetical protein
MADIQPPPPPAPMPRSRVEFGPRRIRDLVAGNGDGFAPVDRDALVVDLDGCAWLRLDAITIDAEDAAEEKSIYVTRRSDGFIVNFGRYRGEKWPRVKIPKDDREDYVPVKDFDPPVTLR